jgi:hypothetical protein
MAGSNDSNDNDEENKVQNDSQETKFKNCLSILLL